VDAALVAWEGTSGGRDHVVIRVDAPASLELAVELPPLHTLGLDATHGKVEVSLDGTQVVAWKVLADRAELDVSRLVASDDAAAYPHVDDETSLVVETADNRIVIGGEGLRVACEFGKPSIRRVVKQHRYQIRRCYEYVAQRDPTVAGTVELHFLIGTDGKVATASATGELPASVTECVAAEARTWEFPVSDASTQVNYPFTFRLR
jgi:hypothetical protein